MPLKKSEMEEHRALYQLLVSQARAALQQGLYEKAIEAASASWEYIDGMMQYERKYEDKEFESVEGIDIVLEYAPLIFDFPSLEKLAELLRSQRRIDKHASDDLAARLASARQSLRDAHRAWSNLELTTKSTGNAIDPKVDQELKSLDAILKRWERMEITTRALRGDSEVPVFRTQMDELVPVKCSSCAAVGKARKAKILEEVTCPRCQKPVLFVILASRN